MSSRTILVDLRGCQFNGDRGIPAYAQSLALELTRGHPRHRWLLLRDDRWPPPNRAAELAAHATWCTAADLDRRQAPAIDVLLTGCFFLPHHGCGADYLLPGWLRRQAPSRARAAFGTARRRPARSLCSQVPALAAPATGSRFRRRMLPASRRATSSWRCKAALHRRLPAAVPQR